MCFTKVLKFTLLLAIASSVNAHQKYWIYHNDTTQLYFSQLGIESEICSKWLNACTYYLSPAETEILTLAGLHLAQVQTFIPYLDDKQFDNPSLENGFALDQIEGDVFKKSGLTGKGVKIGIIDGGFFKANEAESLHHIFQNNRVAAVKDYFYPGQDLYERGNGLKDSHGTEVWQLIGGMNAQKGVQHGLATQATYYLARTDHLTIEKRIEEDYLIAAMEWMSGEGVRLINISLGYDIGFNNAEENYRPEQMDGKTTAIAMAVEYASIQKGILVVVAAGNEANDSWQVVSTPADAEHALTVGASKLNTWDKAGYSSVGPDFVPYIKPDVVVFSSSGTSFAAPIITGLAACLMEYDSLLTNLEIIDLIQKSANCYPHGNNYLGYGVPSCSNLLKLLNGAETEVTRPVKMISPKDQVILRRLFNGSYVVVFHKENAKNVIKREVYHPMKMKLKIKRIDEATQTSVLTGKDLIEIFWR